MAGSKFWDRWGETILAAPDLTLAAFLGHTPSVALAKELGVRIPNAADFNVERRFDPNPFQLDLPKEYLETTFLVLCVSAWGGEALLLTANACSHLQLAHDLECPPEFETLRNEAARALQRFIDSPSTASRGEAEAVRQQCGSLYQPHEESKSAEGELLWYHLGAPWFALEAALDNLQARSDCGEVEPAPMNSTWTVRSSVWPARAADAAAHWSSHSLVRATVRSALITWATARLT